MYCKDRYPLQLHSENKSPRISYQNPTEGYFSDLPEETNYLFGGLHSRGQCELNTIRGKKIYNVQ